MLRLWIVCGKLLRLWIICGKIVAIVDSLWQNCCDCGYFVERLLQLWIVVGKGLHEGRRSMVEECPRVFGVFESMGRKSSL